MAVSYYELYYASGLEMFWGRVAIAAVKVAIDITNEAATVPNHANRFALARAILIEPLARAETLAVIALAANPELASSTAKDQAIYDTLSGLWNSVAGDDR